MHGKFLYPNRFRGVVLDGGMLYVSWLSLCSVGPVPGRSAILNDGTIGKTVRRRRSWYRRRLRMQRTLAAVVVGTVLAGACWQNASHYFSLPTLHASQVLPDSFWTRGNIRKDLAFMAARSAKPAKVLPRMC